MKTTSLTVLAAALLVPGLAAAQPGGYYGGGGQPQGYYAQQAPSTTLPGGFHNRMGRLAIGGSFGLGGMSSQNGITDCANCDVSPVAVELDGHIGGFLSPRFALMAEGQLNAQTVASDAYDSTVLSMSSLLIAGQYWLTPQLWVKGGIGFAQLYASDSYNDYDFGTGGAVMGGLGFEVFSARNFAVDLQGRIIRGTFSDKLDDAVTSGTVGVGVNWY